MKTFYCRLSRFKAYRGFLLAAWDIVKFLLLTATSHRDSEQTTWPRHQGVAYFDSPLSQDLTPFSVSLFVFAAKTHARVSRPPY